MIFPEAIYSYNDTDSNCCCWPRSSTSEIKNDPSPEPPVQQDGEIEFMSESLPPTFPLPPDYYDRTDD